ncbi:hypothetical protein H072_10177 [Dactylellina haptotyla CBS 200.50]|uniref:Ubiquitin 3 binding protein But2 C-terminal domain-containing protein n=1 Tax=Dactylellina haptotyla (strain CBS 200.50) TaxID=1284197 RepID=S8BM20_DACHA|nr:hypothetical protein H072_10177 [Dactylellina haptotyla CBS 200.50]
MKYTIALAALTAVASSLPTPQLPQIINAGPFSLQIAAPGSDLHELFIEILPTPRNSENGKILAITSASKTPNERFELQYNKPVEDPRVPQFGRLIYTPEATPETCKFFLCPTQATPAGYDQDFGPTEYVRDNMRAMFFSPGPASPALSAPPPNGQTLDAPKGDQLQIWTDFQIDFNGFLILNGKSSWYACPTKYPLESSEVYTSIWWSEGSVSDTRCQKIKVRRA